jgi:hypothetical protein
MNAEGGRSRVLFGFLLCLLLGGSSLGVVAARADGLYFVAEDAGALPRRGATVVRIPGGSLLVTPEGAPPPARPGVVDLRAPQGWELLLYHLDPRGDLEAARAVLGERARILHDAGGGCLVLAVPAENLRALDAVHAEKQRLSYLGFTPTAPPQLRPLSEAQREIKDQIVARLDLYDYSNAIRELSGDLEYLIDGVPTVNGDRYTFANSIYKTYDYFADRFESMGYTVQRQYFPIGEVMAQNVIAVKTGSVYPDSIIVVGAHMDAVAGDRVLKHPAPGAEDNASGAAGVLQLAEIFADCRTEKTLHFVGFGAEEQGLWGSEHYVEQMQLHGDQVVAALILDMIAAYETQFSVMIEGEVPWDGLMSIMEGNSVEYGGIPARKVYGSAGSDHVPFSLAGISTFLAADEDWDTYDHYHRSTDTYDKTDPSLGLAILRGMAATLADLTHPLPLTPATVPAQGPGSVLALRNEPNPFNPATVIRFELPEDRRVGLEILDLTGRRIRVLQRGWLEAGSHAIRWDGRDQGGHPVASGVYFYRLEAGAERHSGRMALVR